MKWRTGKLIYDSDTESGHVQSGMPPQAQGQFHTLRIDRQNGIVDLISNTMKLRHYVGTNGMAGESSRPNTPMFWNMQPRPVVGPIRAVKPKSGGGND